MLSTFRWLFRIATALVVLAVVVVVGVYYFLSRSLPDYDTTWRVRGISAEVEIARNTWAVPHIFGQSDADVFYGLGFAHAQDRLWQMTLLRRTAQGRLSEIFGERTLRTDELMRRLDLYHLAQDSVAAQDDDTLAALDAYARGVNAWITLVNDRALGRGAPEFFLFPGEVSLWQPADSIALIKLMAVQLSGQLENEVRRARLSALIGDARTRDLMPEDSSQGLAALPDFASLFPTVTRTQLAMAPVEPIDLPGGALSPFRPFAMAGASNAWAAAPTRSANGGTLLANDPHLGFTAPSIWYLARLNLSSGAVTGGTIPGIPAVLVGRSEALGWALTSSYLDDQDLFMEELDPDDSTRYRTADGWASFETRRSIIQVADADPVTVTLRWSQNGPILPGSHFSLASVTPPGHVAALSWTALTGDDTSMSAAIGIMRAQSVDQALAAGERYVAPAQNLTVIDHDHIAMQLIGRMPRRDAASPTQGRMPAPGWDPAARWQGSFPYSSNPRFYDPPTGLIGNTNNKPLDRPFPLHVSFDWGDTMRIQRWVRLMRQRSVHTRESFIEAQLDTVSQAARTLLPLVGAELWFQGAPAEPGTPEAQRQIALQLLADWNGEMSEHLPEPLIYAAWMRELQFRLIRDELGPTADMFTHLEPEFIERVFNNTDGASVWCDVVQSAVVETCVDIARTALDAALLDLEQHYGPAIESWRWGDAHQAAHDHPVLGDVPILRHFVNIRQSTSGGDNTLMRGRTQGGPPGAAEPFLNVHGAGYRGVYDMADPEASVFIISTGESGHPLSRHYDDLGVLWRRGEYIPMTLDPDLARAGGVGVTRLEPRP
ncbi:MAG: penicillin acylase family protein [Rhodobacter sp.]|uniref:penicillin acylase family protein n=1 Tax=Pararhodobacter sp. TaxID=2127056 RepID=UPI001D850107|nr:penicillin acylase family protein [Pararhodobacter sp.]MCB1344123.1 penicillin acylase family protein [Paracoccaceae bacterium]MCC0073689.1 penicillin acylase family protein [Rhodobacter sp.]HPD93036.1 penicillin acylase family protein [Pararhodobacter sp.]